MDDLKLLNLTGLKEGRSKEKGGSKRDRPRTVGEREKNREVRPSTVGGDVHVRTKDGNEFKVDLLASPIKVPIAKKRTDVYIPIKVKTASGGDEKGEGFAHGLPGDSGGGAAEEQETDQRPISLPLLSGVKKLPRNAFEKKRARHPKFKKPAPVAWPEDAMETTTIYVPEAAAQMKVSQEDFLRKSIDAHSELMEEGRVAGRAAPTSSRGRSGGGTTRRSALEEKQRSMSRSENLERLRLLANAESIIGQMPLAYLASKPELRHFAVERACKLLLKPALVSVHLLVRRAFKIWVKPPVIVLNDKQVGFMVIAKCFEKLLRTAKRRKFNKWAYAYASRYDQDRLIMYREAVLTIQRWYRDVKITTRKAFQTLKMAMEMCLQRRYAINHAIKYEMVRRHAMEKMRKGIA